MLNVKIPGSELWDSEKEEFVYTSDTNLQLEHSLVSLWKWESKWHKPFLNKNYKKTDEETIDYIRCMTMSQNVDPNVYKRLTNDILKQISDYIEDPMSATVVNLPKKKGMNEPPVTAEIFYYLMFSYGIPIECQKWHLNRLIKLIEVFEAKNSDQKKSPAELAKERAALNEARRKALKTKG